MNIRETLAFWKAPMVVRTCAALAAAFVLVMTVLPSAAHASGFFDTVKDKAGDAVDYVQEHGPGWLESAKEGAGNLIEAGKEKLPELQEKAQDGFEAVKDGVTTARDEFAEWNGQQPDIFWDWFEQQTGVGTTSTNNSQTGTGTETTPAPEPSYYLDAEGNPLPFGVTPEMLEELKDGTIVYYDPDPTASAEVPPASNAPESNNHAQAETNATSAQAETTNAPAQGPEPAPLISDNAVSIIVIGVVCVAMLIGAVVVIVCHYKSIYG